MAPGGSSANKHMQFYGIKVTTNLKYGWVAHQHLHRSKKQTPFTPSSPEEIAADATRRCEQSRVCRDYYETFLSELSAALQVEKSIATGKLEPSKTMSEIVLDISANILTAASSAVPVLGSAVGMGAQAVNKAYNIKKSRDKRMFAAAVAQWTLLTIIDEQLVKALAQQLVLLRATDLSFSNKLSALSLTDSLQDTAYSAYRRLLEDKFLNLAQKQALTDAAAIIAIMAEICPNNDTALQDSPAWLKSNTRQLNNNFRSAMPLKQQRLMLYRQRLLHRDTPTDVAGKMFLLTRCCLR